MTLEERAACIADISLQGAVRGAERRRRIYNRALKMLCEVAADPNGYKAGAVANMNRLNAGSPD